ncbi:hypothetical protein ACVW19_000055 [Streptomyces sp. TE5632]
MLALGLRLTAEPLLKEILDAWFAGGPDRPRTTGRTWTGWTGSTTPGPPAEPYRRPAADHSRTTTGAVSSVTPPGGSNSRSTMSAGDSGPRVRWRRSE